MSGEWVGGVSLCYKEDKEDILQGSCLEEKNISFEPFDSTYALRLILVSS